MLSGFHPIWMILFRKKKEKLMKILLLMLWSQLGQTAYVACMCFCVCVCIRRLRSTGLTILPHEYPTPLWRGGMVRAYAIVVGVYSLCVFKWRLTILVQLWGMFHAKFLYVFVGSCIEICTCTTTHKYHKISASYVPNNHRILNLELSTLFGIQQ